ncbi:hypothetical protein C8024_05935 [Sphingopyxis sp. BSNA05]|uniref:sensor histidine kinase n=1 Tax=Sphingopyxis sp. BSNA05 TaxID=1236614 RepID=UPI001564B387|nr:sensor histidine kinase [Sphingopyxis sp. BSNA05]NRD89085.1 hypothetical protein [Sphingopyxis sp. BSNA05]
MLSTALQISRAEAGIGKDRFQNVSISQLLIDLSEIYGPLAEEQGVEIVVRAPKNLNAEIHRELINQALGNLIENALKYASTADEIVLDAEATDDGFILIVSDNGSGIPDEQMAKALKRFGRLDPARQESGSGLGLSLVEAVAKLHGGGLLLKQNAPGLKVEIFLKNADNNFG